MNANHPPVNLDLAKITIKLNDATLPSAADFPAWMAMTAAVPNFLAYLVGK